MSLHFLRMSSFLSFKFIGALYSAMIVPVVYFRWQSRDKRRENEAFLAAHGMHAPEAERMRAITHLLSGEAIRVDSNEHFEGSRNCAVVRKRVGQQARGSVLEIGIGTGEHSIPQLERNMHVTKITGIDTHLLSLEICKENLEKTVLTKPATLILGRAEELPFATNSFDSVISQFSLCATEDPVRALKEMARVAKNRIIILEHGLSYWRIVRWLGYWTSLFPDPQHPWSYGCYQDRDVLEIVKKSGVKIRKMKTSSLGHVYLLSLAPNEQEEDVRDMPEPHIVFHTNDRVSYSQVYFGYRMKSQETCQDSCTCAKQADVITAKRRPNNDSTDFDGTYPPYPGIALPKLFSVNLLGGSVSIRCGRVPVYPEIPGTEKVRQRGPGSRMRIPGFNAVLP